MKKLLLLSLLCAAVASLSPLRGDEPFTVVVTSMETTSPTIGYPNFPDLLNDVLNGRGVFAQYENYDFSANLSFLGIANAITAHSMDNGTMVDLQIPGINFTKQFTGPTRSNVEQQIKDFFVKDGSTVIGDFLNYISRKSAVAVTDGNPSSSTALMANNTFYSSGFTPTNELTDTPAEAAAGTPAAQTNLSGLGIGFNSGRFNANGISGTFNDFAIPFKIRLSDNVSLAGSVPFDMLSVEGAKIYGVGLNLGVPVRIEVMTKDEPTNWRLTPLLGISARGSQDLAGGGVIWMAGLNNSVDYRVNHKLIVCMVNQLTTHHGLDVKYSTYEFNTKVDQLMLKDGIRFVSPLSERMTGDLFVIETNFLKEAAVKNFTTLGVSISYRVTQKQNVTLGFNYDTGSNYRSSSAGLSSAWKF